MIIHILIVTLIIGAIVLGCVAIKDTNKTGEEAMTSIFPAIGACACVAWLLAIAIFYFLKRLL
jgi:hypothetical protein